MNQDFIAILKNRFSGQNKKARLNSAAQTNCEKGKRYFENGDYNAAITEFTEAIRLNPNYITAYAARADVYREKRKYDAVIKDCNKAVKLDPNAALAYSIRGLAYQDKGDYDAAFRDITEAVRIDSNDYDTYGLHGDRYQLKFEYNAAYDEAAGLDPNDVFTYGKRAQIYRELGQRAYTILNLKRTLKLNPSLDWAELELREMQVD
jgi:tetratricopeptide (TPR) repeat protein